MKVQIETKDSSLLRKLMPLIEVAQKYKGHFNASYTAKDSDYVVLDNIHKKHCLELLNKVNNDFIIGTGGGHIWVALHTATRFSYTSSIKDEPVKAIPGEAIACNGIRDRLLLITDEN